jgi:hypothetical protein
LAAKITRQSASEISSIAPADLPAHAAGGVDQQIELARLRDDLSDQCLRRLRRAEIGGMRGRADGLCRGGNARGIDIGEVHGGAGRDQRGGDGAADALGRAGDEGYAVVEADLHWSISTFSVSKESGRLPSSISWMRETSRSSVGVATPASRPSLAMMPIWGSTSVLRLRTARSRQMPEWVFALFEV